jgi:hypothetical protein
VVLLVLGALLLAVGAALAQGGGYDLSWHTVDGGGAADLAGLSYTLRGTAGQPDAGALSGGSYALGGGFWSLGVSAVPVVPLQPARYLPLILE